jgi:hypothetical protein
MKLVELLARELDSWAAGQVAAVQDPDADGTVWFVSSNAGLEFNGSEWKYDGYFEIAISRPSNRAEDYDSAIITRAQWQAERDRQKGGEWKRHRGGKRPISCASLVDVKRRNGDIMQCRAGILEWKHSRKGDDVMQYKVIGQPQAEEVEYRGPFPCAPVGKPEDAIEFDIEFPSGACKLEAQVDQVDGPIKWRDTIIHCQAIIEDCEREIQRNVDLLDAEGLMMQTDSKKAMQHYAPDVDMSDWRNWKVSDKIRMTSRDWCDLTKGAIYEIVDTGDDFIKIIDDVDYRRSLEVDGETMLEDGRLLDFEFVSSP